MKVLIFLLFWVTVASLFTQVKAPGVTKDMVGRWQSKDGRLDCSSMDYVPFCGVSLEEKCGQTYTVQSGIGGVLNLDILSTLS